MSRSGKRNVFFLLFSLLVALFLASYLAGRLGLLKKEKLPLSSQKIGVVYVHGILEESRGVIQELEFTGKAEDKPAQTTMLPQQQPMNLSDMPDDIPF